MISAPGVSMPDFNYQPIRDINEELLVELGRRNMKLREVLELEEGGVIELETKSGDPHIMRMGEADLAEGEIEVIDDKFFFRIKGIISPDRREVISNLINA